MPPKKFSVMGLLNEIENELATLPQMQSTATSRKQYVIGVPHESAECETRVGLTPQAVSILTEGGHRVLVAQGAGVNAGFSDLDYSEAGAEVVDAGRALQADIIFKVQALNADEIALLKPKAVVFSALTLKYHDSNYFRALQDSKITAVGYEFMADRYGHHNFLRAMNGISGNVSYMVASEYLSNRLYGNGSMLGSVAGIPPTEVVILGAGRSAETATKMFVAAGADVKIFDNSISRLNEISQRLQTPVYTSVIYPELLKKTIAEADVLIAAFHSNEPDSQYIVTEEMVSSMKHGSIIIDIGIDLCNTVETSRATTINNPVFVKHGVLHYCVPNMPACVPKTASMAISNLLVPILIRIAEGADTKALMAENEELQQGVYCYSGILTSQTVASYVGLVAKDLQILLKLPLC